MTSLEKSLLVHLARASTYLEASAADACKSEIDAAIALLTAEKPKRRRQSSRS